MLPRRHERVVRAALVQAVDLPYAGQREQSHDRQYEDMAQDPTRTQEEAVHGAGSVCDIHAE